MVGGSTADMEMIMWLEAFTLLLEYSILSWYVYIKMYVKRVKYLRYDFFLISTFLPQFTKVIKIQHFMKYSVQDAS